MGKAMLSALFKSTVLSLALMVGALSSGAARAEVLLTIEAGNGQPVTYSRADLDALPRVTFKTSTQWTKGVLEFSGVPLKALLEGVGITSGTVRAVAVNDYIVEIPFESLADDAPIVADQIDGKTFSRREKGPLWIMYPFDKANSYRTEENFGRSVWQLVRLTQQ
jgi:hypothetical protein